MSGFNFDRAIRAHVQRNAPLPRSLHSAPTAIGNETGPLPAGTGVHLVASHADLPLGQAGQVDISDFNDRAAA